jgi:hypothetical protein
MARSSASHQTNFPFPIQARSNKVYGTGTKFRKSEFYSLSEAYGEEGLLPDPFILTVPDRHSYMRRNASNEYALHGLVQREPFLEPVTARFLEILQGYADREQAAPIDKLLGDYAMDGVVSLTFGKDFDYLTQGDGFKITPVMGFIARYMAIVSYKPNSAGMLS